MCKLIADCHLIWTLDNSWFIVLFFSDAHLCIIARRKEALDSGIRLFQAIVCDLLICQGIFNFLFVPKEIKFLDVVQFMCRWKWEITKQSSMSTGVYRTNTAILA